MSLIVIQTLKETVPFFELFNDGETVELNESLIRTINKLRPDDVKNFKSTL